MSTLARKALRDQLKPLLPKRWHIVASSREVANVQTTVVQLQQVSLARLQQGGGRAYSIDFQATITAPESTTQAAEDNLDDGVLELVGALTSAGLMWRDCEKVLTPNRQQLQYQLTITIHAKN